MKLRAATYLLGATLVAMGSSMAHAQGAMTDGEVRKVDVDNKKITVKHGEIKNLDMPPMTMVFGVGDPKLLEKLQPGDKIQFRAVNEGGKFVVTDIQPAK